MIDIVQLAEDVNNHADIVQVIGSYLPLIKKGKNYMAVCPFHDDNDPSLTISPEKQFFKCFVCGTGGKAISFVQKYEHITFLEAIKKVAELSNYHPDGLNGINVQRRVDDREEAILKCLSDLNHYYEFALNTPEGKNGLDYFESRHLDKNLRNKYKLGYAFKDGKSTIEFLLKKGHSIKTIEDTGISKLIGNNIYADMNEGRVTFPICNAEGGVIGFSARILEKSDQPKYMNTPETYLFHKTNVLYNFHIAKQAAKLKGYIYVCEGFMDVYALSRIGIDAAVAIMGTALTKEHCSLLRSLNVEIRLCLDGDLAGQRAMMKVCSLFEKENLRFSIVDNQGSVKDPDEILNEDGEEALKAYLAKTISKEDFILNYYLRMNPLKSVDEKKRLVKEFLPILVKINSQLELDSYINKIVGITGFTSESIKELVKKGRVQNDGTSESIKNVIKDYHPERKLLQKLMNAEREFLYQMMNNDFAVDFYERNNLTFEDDIYRQIANYILEYKNTYNKVDSGAIRTMLEISDDSNKEELINDFDNIVFEDFHPKVCNEELLSNLYETMNEEKEKISFEDKIKESLVGKSELEKARIISDFNRRKSLKK